MILQLTILFNNLYKSDKKSHMTKNEKIITQTLQYENLSASAIANKSGLSQPTVSRALQNMPVIKIGGGRSSRFALVKPGHSHPLYHVNTEGLISELGELYQQTNSRSLLVSQGEFRGYDALPFYLYDSLPAGFLGAITLKKIVKNDTALNTNSRDWSDSQILHYLTRYGYDLPGNLVLGKEMATIAAEVGYKKIAPSEYAFITNKINQSPDSFGSSIGGEQPKFTLFNGTSHLIVKYSPLLSEANPVAIRHRDLMICEHLALQALQNGGIEAAESNLIFDDRIYLEIKRFDRMGEYGRKGMASLRSMDAEYAGINTTWPEIGKSLLKNKLISAKDYFMIEVCYAFGRFIANTDMHNGNFSFFMEGVSIGTATPIYDMLPMAFMPVQGELRNPEMTIPRFIETSQASQLKAKTLAIEFWKRVFEHPSVSEDFKSRTQNLYHTLLSSDLKFN